MSKVSVAFALISTLAFTSADAPTFQLWRDLPAEDLMASAEPIDSNFSSYVAGASFTSSGLYQELSEDDALDRFEIDDMYLPKLNVELPELFDWSDIDNTYFAHESPTHVSPASSVLDNYGGAAFRVASLQGSSDNGDVATRIAGLTQSTSSAEPTIQSAGKSSGGTEQNTSIDLIDEDATPVVSPTPDEEQFAGNDAPTNVTEQIVQLPETSVIDTSIDRPTPIVSKDPVQVPSPGTWALFVLGLAGLRLGVRKKNGSG
jgi:hypothetical protein